MSDPFALHDVWLAAVNALPDPRPIAALLRSDTPMPNGARHLLAELFHPGNPPITDWEVLPQRNPEFARMIRKLTVTSTYKRALADGTPARKAAEEAGKEANVTARQAFRWIQENVPERLRDRLCKSQLDRADILALLNVSNEAGSSVVNDEMANFVVIGAMSMTR
jgi:hypothetical protein